MDEERARIFQEELDKEIAKLPPEEIQRLTQPILAPALKEALDSMNRTIEAFNNAMNGIFSKNNEAFAKMAAIAEGMRVMQADLKKLGVNSLTEADELFPEFAKGAIFHVIDLARKHLETGLMLKDYVEAINPDYTVREDFLFKGELEQTLLEAAEDIAEYLALDKEKPKEDRADKLYKARKIREKAKATGAITTLNNHLATFSRKGLTDVFTSNCIFYVDDIGKAAGQFDEFGQLQAQLEFTQLAQVHTQFLMVFCKALLSKLIDEKGDRIQVDGKDATVSLYLPTIANELGIEARKPLEERSANDDLKQLRLQKFRDKILPFEKFVGVLPNGSNYRVLLYKGYDSETDTIKIESPYIYKLFEIENNKKYSLSLNELFHSNIVGEPSAAVEMAAKILESLKRRGTTNKEEGWVIWHTFWEELIFKCPQLATKLHDVMDSDKKNKAMYFNKIIADTVSAAYRIIMEKTDAPFYYKELTFEPAFMDGELKPPTKSQIAKTEIIVKHKGQNTKYKRSI